MASTFDIKLTLHELEFGSVGLQETVKSLQTTNDGKIVTLTPGVKEVKICSVNFCIDCNGTTWHLLPDRLLSNLPIPATIDFKRGDSIDDTVLDSLIIYPNWHTPGEQVQDDYLFKCTLSQKTSPDQLTSLLMSFASLESNAPSNTTKSRKGRRGFKSWSPRHAKHIRCANATLNAFDPSKSIIVSFDLLCRLKLDTYNNFGYETNRLLDTLFSSRSNIENSVTTNSIYIQKLFRHQTSQFTREQIGGNKALSNCVDDNIKWLKLTLLPFQKRSVQWMLEKETRVEQKHSTNDDDDDDFSTVDSILNYLNSNVCYGYEVISAENSFCNGCPEIQHYFWNKFTGYITDLDTARSICEKNQMSNDGARGVLAEEMGLGKTIEVLALILLHKRSLHPKLSRYRDDETGRLVRRVKTTLIICPNSLLLQWIGEILDHTEAGSLKVLHYLGTKEVKQKFQTQDNDELVDTLAKFDIIITTYRVINKEVHYAQFNPNIRSRRSADGKPKYDYTSPLVLMNFFRIILDEVQMLRSNSTQAAKCTALLHRVHTWGVSGTPVRHIRDINTILGYLRFHPFCDQTTGIVSEISDNISEGKQGATVAKGISFTLTDLLHIFTEHNLVIGHSKEDVADQIKIPKQTKYLIPLEFNPIEWDNYLQSWSRFLSVSGYGPHGEGTTSLNSRQLNNWLLQLRQLCCHAIVQPGHLDPRYRSANGVHRRGRHYYYRHRSHHQIAGNSDSNESAGSVVTGARLYNLAEILDDMIAKSKDTTAALIRENFQLQIRKAQVDMELNNRVEDGIELLQSVNKGICGKLFDDFGIVDPFNDIKFSADSDVKLNSRIRFYLDLLHQCYFFIATGYYLMGSKKLELVDEENEKRRLLKSDDIMKTKPVKYTDVYSSTEIETIERLQRLELEKYEKAEMLRKLILQEQNVKVQIIMDETKDLRTRFSQGLSIVEFDGRNFAENWTSLNSFKSMDHMLNVLNSQALQFNEICVKLLDLLYGSITKEYTEENIDKKAQEYASSIEDQDKIFAYLHSLEELLKNRNFVVSSDEEEIKLSPQATSVTIDPTYSKFHVSLIKRLRLITGGSSLKAIFNELKNSRVVAYSLNKKNKHKKSKIQSFEDYLLEYEDYIPRFKHEITVFKEGLKKLNAVYNAKLEYYSHLQRISDSLVSIHELGDRERTSILNAIQDNKLYVKNQEKISQTESRLKYLSNLSKLKELMDSGESITCTICLGGISLGSMVRCGHFFCKDCIYGWLKHHSTCPICKRETTLHEIYNFKFRNETSGSSKAVSSPTKRLINQHTSKSSSTRDITTSTTTSIKRTETISNSLEATLDNEYIIFEDMNEVHKMTIRENFGAKVDFVVKLILFLKLKAQGQKEQPPQILVYSQNVAFLKVITQTFDLNHITYLSAFHNSGNISSTIDKFKHDINVTCLLLTISSLSSGLNLLNAKHIFLLDPIINHNEELQAMSRNNRIGQDKETYVWNFMIRDTVEESIFKYKAALENNRRMHGHGGHHSPAGGWQDSDSSDGGLSSEGEDENKDDDDDSDYEINEDTTERVADKHLWHCFFQS